MNDLVFIDPNKIGAVPFTTSKVVSEWSGVGHKKIKEAIRKYRRDIESFGLLDSYQTESTGGRPEEFYRMNEAQATFLLTLLKNTEPVIKFKKELVRQFYAMRTELMKRRDYREALKPIRREMTDVIQEINHSKWDYKLYTDLSYRAVTGKSAAQLRKEKDAPKDANIIEYLTADEIERVAGLQQKIGLLLELGMEYYQIKDLLLNRQMIRAS